MPPGTVGVVGAGFMGSGIAESAARTGERVRVFEPVPVMKLVEVVVGLDSSDQTVTSAEAFVQRLGKRPIRTKDRSGFIVNMLLVPHLMAAVRMYEEGFASREDIDEGMHLGCGHPMGPRPCATSSASTSSTTSATRSTRSSSAPSTRPAAD